MGACVGRKKVEPEKCNSKESKCRHSASRYHVDVLHSRDIKRRETRWNKIVEEKYTIFSAIGKGEFGCVVRAENKQTKIPCAIKIIDLTKDMNEKSTFMLELKILRTVQHKYVIKLHDVIETSQRLYLVMELATGGELMDKISTLGKFDENDAARVLSMILDGLAYLHSVGITHRDLKPQNILYYHPGNDSRIIITDFGLSTIRNTSNYLMNTDCGTIEYMAPEVITRISYTNAVDMWSMGVIAYIVLSGRLPFPLTGNTMSTVRMICFCKYNFDGEPWDDVSNEAKDFIKSLLLVDPTRRLTAKDALKHKWIKGEQLGHHKKLNLQRSICSNWSDSCVSLKNEKDGRKQERIRERSSDLSRACGNVREGNLTYGLVRQSNEGKTVTMGEKMRKAEKIDHLPKAKCKIAKQDSNEISNAKDKQKCKDSEMPSNTHARGRHPRDHVRTRRSEEIRQ